MDSKSLFVRIFLSVIVLAIVSYAFFRFYPLVAGPSVTIVSPEDNLTTTSEDFVDLEIETKRAVLLEIQGNSIDIQIENLTIHRVYLSEGINTVKVYAEDAYGTSKDLSIFVLKN